MISSRLEKFVRRARQAKRVGFGDLRRLERDVLPLGLMNREEAEDLIALDHHLERADAGWLPFLSVAIRTFVDERTAGVGDPETATWLAGVLAEARSRTALVLAKAVIQDRAEVNEALRSFVKPCPVPSSRTENTMGAISLTSPP